MTIDQTSTILPADQREFARLSAKLATFIDLEQLVDETEDPEGKLSMREQIQEIRDNLARLTPATTGEPVA